MMVGYVQYNHAFVQVNFLRQNGSPVPVECVVDTGFTSHLTLPLSDVAVLALPFQRYIEVYLADNSATLVAVHNAVILWHGDPMELEVIATGERPLLGLALLKDNDLHVNFTENGVVTITPQALTAP